MLWIEGKEVGQLWIGGKPVQALYVGAKLIWEAIKSISGKAHFTG